jgi:hypothetical protein
MPFAKPPKWWRTPWADRFQGFEPSASGQRVDAGTRCGFCDCIAIIYGRDENIILGETGICYSHACALFSAK